MNVTLLCFELKLESICGTSDSVYYSGYDLFFHILMYITTEQFVFLPVKVRERHVDDRLLCACFKQEKRSFFARCPFVFVVYSFFFVN